MAVSTNPSAVIDASFLLAYLLPDETSPQVDEVMDLHYHHLIQLIAPPLLLYETISGLNTAILRQKINLKTALDLLDQTLKLNFSLVDNQTSVVLKLAQKHHLSAYDASYLELSQRLKLSLYSLDKKLVSLTKA